jgi:hypothetical protein
MTKDEAWQIIRELRWWDIDQSSVSPAADAVFSARRIALRNAWLTLGEHEKADAIPIRTVNGV